MQNISKPAGPPVRRIAVGMGVLIVTLILAALTFRVYWLRSHNRPNPTPPVFSRAASYPVYGAGDINLSGTLDAHALAQAERGLGRPGAFMGKVARVYQRYPRSVVVLDFDVNYRSALVATIEPWNQVKFPPPASLKGRRVQIIGTWVRNRGGIGIDLASPSQVRILVK